MVIKVVNNLVVIVMVFVGCFVCVCDVCVIKGVYWFCVVDDVYLCIVCDIQVYFVNVFFFCYERVCFLLNGIFLKFKVFKEEERCGDYYYKLKK